MTKGGFISNVSPPIDAFELRASLIDFGDIINGNFPRDFDSSVLYNVIGGLADAAEASKSTEGGGIFAGLVTLTENSIDGLHTLLQGMGVANSFGLAIILFTLFIKAVTFPLTYQQLESTTKMQALQPKVKDIQKRLGNNPEAANREIAELYKSEEVNPLSGCLPSLAQIPIFIALYRALLNLASENKLSEPFLWIPNLEGPTFQSAPAESLNWLKKWVDGAPLLGWHDTLCYLSIPVILMLTQSASTKLMQPPRKPDAPEDTSQAILKYLPLLIGWFSLNVPSGLGLYWIVNNIVSTAASVGIRNRLGASTMQEPITLENPTSKVGTLNSEGTLEKNAGDDGEQVDAESKGFSQKTPEEMNTDQTLLSESPKPKKTSKGKKKRSKR
eukprot:CAMPEP_0171476230 /NCGR_PEP_ID=MMETSP0946-20130122/3467_1 /TAXON_ID=109269 /ORGANISM="Vaucheria litorea, Strain CCMP2940" /LENGTH=386 /DNA_ID=CAMNT_0012006453 /DNA_START=94 /DNA_END=1255 /DNA_ORIENTATION=+